MSPPPKPILSDHQLPQKVDVAVIGGGIIGVMTALTLAERGVSVALFEKGVIAGEQSSRNWGWCRQMGRDLREIPLILESLKQWRGMNERVGAETGYRQAGIVYLCRDEKQLAERRAWLEKARRFGVSSETTGPNRVAHLVPGAATAFAGALYTHDDGRAEPELAVPAMAEAARICGAKIYTNCAVRGIETSAGRVSAVVSERGPVACSSVVLAGGAWSRLFCRNLKLTLPQLKVLSSVMRTAPLSGAPEVSTAGDDYAFRKRLDGGYTVAHGAISISPITPDSFNFFFQFLPALKAEWKSMRLRIGARYSLESGWPTDWELDQVTVFERVRVLDPKPVEWVLEAARKNLSAAFPIFAKMQVAQSWAGMIDVTPDAVPVISPVDSIPGLVIATGFSGHGFGIGPGAGALAADLVMGNRPVVDPHPFRFSRFSDGSKISVETGL